MNPQSTIPFIGGFKDGHRFTTNEYPQPWVRFYEPMPINFEKPIHPSSSRNFKEHAYEGNKDACGRMFYFPLNSDPKEAVAAAFDKYPAPTDPSKILVPVDLLYDVLRQIGNPNADMNQSDRLYRLVLEHYRNHPPTP